ncbi:MAG: GNAT family N-acetyltransferase [Candidatus Micrarchaeota archaeon]|nr:GNAT family N-acetyltransferase [Candidatus Micrarchaeota archaeon]
MQKTKESIKRASLHDLDTLLDIYETCNDWLLKKGMNHWQGVYSREVVSQRIKEMDVYIIYEKDLPVGTISLSNKPSSFYRETDMAFFKDKNAPAIYLRGLAILPGHQGKGLASKLMAFAEQKVKEKGIPYIRFDSVGFEYFDKFNASYLRKGYHVVGKRGNSLFFEKIL